MANTYTPIQDYFKNSGQDYSSSNLGALAASKGISNYTGTDAQNTQLSGMLAPTTPLVVNTPTKGNFGSLTANNSIYGNLSTPSTNTINTQPVVNYAQLANDSFNQVDENPYAVENQSIVNKYKTSMGLLEGKSTDTRDYNQSLGVNESRANITDLSSQILALNNKTQSDKLGIGMNQGGLTVNDRNANESMIDRQSAIKSLTLGAQLNAAQGKLSLAQDLVNQAISAKYDPIETRINNLKTTLELNKPFLERYDKKAYEKQTALLNAKQKDLEERKKNETDIQNLIINASQQGASSNLMAQASKAKTPMEAAQILGQYAGDYRKARLLEAQIKTEFAQQSKYYADAAKTRREIRALTVDGKSTNTADQSRFLLETVKNALKLSNASGPSAITKYSGDMLKGDTDFRRLEAQVRTLKNNLLTLATDPNIKKFFGPQMSDNDVKNMLSAGSTMDAEANSPQEMKAELKRVQNIFVKFLPVEEQVSNTIMESKDIVNSSAGASYGSYQFNN